MTQTTLSTKASKLIHDKGIVIECEKHWDSHAINKINDGFGLTSDGEYPALSFGEYPAPNFQELILALDSIGEVMGWDGKTKELRHGNWDEVSNMTSEYISMTKYQAHKLLDIFLKEGMSGCDKEVESWFNSDK